MKFRLKKYIKDRDKSYERSKNGELELLNPHNIKEVIIEPLKKIIHPLNDKAENCPHKLALGCNLLKNKRTKAECEACL